MKGFIQKVNTTINSRNKQWDLMRALAIVAVVWGHNFQPPYVFFPAFFFHMSLFFFISGYFFSPQITVRDKLKYFFKKTRRLLIPYIVLNIIFGLLTAFLKYFDIQLGSNFSFEAIGIMLFGRGDHFKLFLTSWFLVDLFTISIFAGLIYTKKTMVNFTIAVIAFGLMLVILDVANRQDKTMWVDYFIRIIFGFSFFSLGYIFKLCERYIQKFIIKPVSIVLFYIIVNVLSANFGSVSYSIVTGKLSNNIVIVPIVTSICIILIVYAIAYYAVKIFRDGSIVYEVGKHSLSIMVWHLTIFFLVNLLLYKLSLIQYTDLSNVYLKYNVEKLWLIYQVPAILIPVYIAKGLSLVMKKFFLAIRTIPDTKISSDLSHQFEL